MPVNTVAQARRGAFAFTAWQVLLPLLTQARAVDVEVFARMLCTCREWRALLADQKAVSVYLRKHSFLEHVQRFMQAFYRVWLPVLHMPAQAQESGHSNLVARSVFMRLPCMEEHCKYMKGCARVLHSAQVINIVVGTVACKTRYSIAQYQRILYTFALNALTLTELRSNCMTTFFFTNVNHRRDVCAVLLVVYSLCVLAPKHRLALRVHLPAAVPSVGCNGRRPLPVFSETDFVPGTARGKTHACVIRAWEQHKLSADTCFAVAVSLCVRGRFEHADPFDPFPRLA